MVIVCPGCKNQITLDDATIPSGAFKVRCTGCGRSITTQKKEEVQQSPAAASTPTKPAATTAEKSRPQATTDVGKVPPEFQNFVNSQIAAAKQEILGAIQTLLGGSSTTRISGPDERLISTNSALLCGGDSSALEALVGIVKSMGYHVQSCTTAAESLKSVDSLYDLIIIDPSFTDDLEGPKKLIGRINSKKAVDRRKVFLVLLSSTQKSLDGNSAFLGGVNLIINKADLNNLESYIRQSQKHFQKLYSAFESV